MIKFSETAVYNFSGAMRGLRNPKNSWDKSDSYFDPAVGEYILGKKDIELGQKMILGGTDESKFLRQIFVSTDIEAPLYWWKEADTYKIGTVSNSCSTMHKLPTTEITKDNFSFDNDLPSDDEFSFIRDNIISDCERLRQHYLKTKDKKYWRALIQLLPCSWNQKRTITLNYQVLRAMYFARKHHKLIEWREFCDWIETLPYAKELICFNKEKNNE